MKLSARNVLQGKVVAVKKGVTTANVKIELARGAVVTASITMEAARELKLKAGDRAFAIIKASDVMVGK
jgi:molybdopterin-binding protein